MAGPAPVQFESVISGVGAGQFPGQGAAQNDTYIFIDNVDVGFPLNCDYVLPKNLQRLLGAKLSIKLRAFRTYNTFSAVATAAGSAHAHSHTHGSHVHSFHVAAAGVAGTTLSARDDLSSVVAADTAAHTLTDPVQGTTPAASAVTEAAHTHPVSISSTLGIFEGTSPTGVTVTIDGVDKTATLGGPFNADQVEVNLAKVLPITLGAFHTIALGTTQQGRLEAVLRVTYYANAQVEA